MNLRGMGQGTCGQCQLKGRDCIQETIIVFNPEHSSPPCCGLSEVPLPHAAHAGAVGFVIALALSTAVWLKPERKMTPEERGRGRIRGFGAAWNGSVSLGRALKL